MWMEVYDSKEGDSISGRIGSAERPALDYDYQAEEWVNITHTRAELVKWILFDRQGERCIWERKPGDTRLPVITFKADRYQGEYCV